MPIFYTEFVEKFSLFSDLVYYLWVENRCRQQCALDGSREAEFQLLLAQILNRLFIHHI